MTILSYSRNNLQSSLYDCYARLMNEWLARCMMKQSNPTQSWGQGEETTIIATIALT